MKLVRPSTSPLHPSTNFPPRNTLYYPIFRDGREIEEGMRAERPGLYFRPYFRPNAERPGLYFRPYFRPNAERPGLYFRPNAKSKLSLTLHWRPKYCLGSNPSASCLVITVKGCTILIDCGLELSQLLVFDPGLGRAAHRPAQAEPSSLVELNEVFRVFGRTQVFVQDPTLRFALPAFSALDCTRIDYILVSNHLNILALPYLTERLAQNAKVVATEPTVSIGRQMLHELVQFVHDSATEGWNSSGQVGDLPPWQNPHVLSSLPQELVGQLSGSTDWRKLYTKKEVEASLARIKACSFEQTITLYNQVTVTAVSSGYSLGSANWVIGTHKSKVGYVAHSSAVSTSMAASLSTQTNVKTQPYHAQAMNEAALDRCDALIFSPGAFASPALKAGFDAYLAEFCNRIGLALRGGGSVLVPTYPCGLVLDLMPILNVYLNNLGFQRVPIYFVSPAAETVLAIANISAEWLHTDKQNRAYAPDEPFIHNELMSAGRLRRFGSIHEPAFASSLQLPCVLFAGHPSLRCGDLVHLVNVWKNDSRNAIVFIEPEYEPARSLMPFDPVAMQASFCPLDSRLTPQDVERLLKRWAPAKVVVPSQFAELVSMTPLPGTEVITTSHLSAQPIPLRREFEKAQMTFQLATAINPKSYGSTAFSPVVATLKAHDGVVTLDLPKTSPPAVTASVSTAPTSPFVNSNRMWGQLAIDRLLASLPKAGISDALIRTKLEHETTISIPSRSTTLVLTAVETTIVTDLDHERRFFAKFIASHLISGTT